MGKLFFILNILLFASVGIMTSYGDISKKKIMNKWLIWGAKRAVIVFGIFFILSVLSITKILKIPFPLFTLRLFADILLNTFIAFIMAVLLWYLEIWAAGDAKLFVLYAFLLPLPFYVKSYVKYFPSFIFLLNIFIPIFLYVLARFFLYLTGEAAGLLKKYDVLKKELIKNIRASWRDWAYQLIGYQTLFLFLGFIQMLLNNIFSRIFPIQGLVFFLILFGRKYIAKIFNNKAIRTVFLVSFLFLLILGAFYEPNQASSMFLSSLKLTISLMILIRLINYLFDIYIEKREVSVLTIDKLKPYMLLAARSQFVLKRDKKFFQENIKRFYPDGLLEDQVKAVKKWYETEGIKTVEIYKTFPFAPFVFAGGIITLLFKGSPFVWIAVKMLKEIDINLGLQLFHMFIQN